MTKQPVCGNAPAMSRRTMLAGLSVAPAGALGAMPLPAAASPTRIIVVYHEIERLEREGMAAVRAGVEEDELQKRFFGPQDGLTRELMALPCTSAADFAAKVVIDTCHGDLFTDWNEGKLWIEARALIEEAS